MDATDQALLREFATRRCERSFRRLVERHLRLVYSVAERVTGERGLAEEVAQTTFAKLAEKSPELDADTVIAGWLYHTARNLALMTVRSEVRRRQREEIAATMNTDEPGPSVVAEHLESAMDQLPPADRDALVLRFFEDRNLRDVGHELGLTEDAARMRVNRALEKLRSVFSKLGITGSAAWLGTTLTSSASASVPVGLGATITTTVLAGTAVASATTALINETTATTMNLFNLKTTAAVLAAAAVTGTTSYLVQERKAERLRADYQTLNETHGKLAAEQQDARALIQLRDEQVAALKREVAELPRQRGEVDRLNRELARLEDAREEIARLRSRLAEQSGADSRPQGEALAVPGTTEQELVNEAWNSMQFVSAAIAQHQLEKRSWPPGLSQLFATYIPAEVGNRLGGPNRFVMFDYIRTTPADQLPADAVVIMEREPRRSSDGTYVQAYFLADGTIAVAKGVGAMKSGANDIPVFNREQLVR